MRWFGQYKEQYRKTLVLAGPVVLSQIGQVVVQLVDNAMVGRLGATPLAAVSFGGTIFFITFILCMGLTMGLTPLVGEMYSRGSHRISADYLQNSLLMFFVVGLLAFGVQMAVTPLMFHMGQPGDVVAQAIPYYRYLVWSVIPFMVFAAFKQFLEGVGNTTVSMFIIITANVINVLLNYLLIYGNWGFPKMGAAGAGLATLISRIFMPVAVVIYFATKDKFRRYLKFFAVDRFSWSRLKSLLSVGLPISLQMFMEGGAFAITSIMMGWIGTVALASNQIANVISNFAFMMVVGISAATTIRISHEYGTGNLRELKKVATASYHITIAWNFFTALLFITLRKYIPMIFTSDPEVLEVASYLMIFVAAFQISDGLQAISIGILRGIQDVKSVMFIAFLSYIVINLPIGYFLAFVLDWGPGGLWTGFIFGLSTAAVLLGLRFSRQYRKLRLRKIGTAAL